MKADAPLYSSFEGTTTGNENSRAAAARAAELRSELRKQRIRERSEEASTAEADFQDPRDQWGNYVQRCGKWSPTGRVRKPSPDKLRLAHNTRERIFSEQSANAEATMAEMAGGGLGPVLDYTAALEAADAEKAAAATPLLAQTSPGRKPRPPTSTPLAAGWASTSRPSLPARPAPPRATCGRSRARTSSSSTASTS